MVGMNVSDYAGFGEFTPLPVETLPGWRGRAVDVLVTISPAPVISALVVPAIALWAERVDGEATAAAFTFGGAGVGVCVSAAALRDGTADGITMVITTDGVGLWLRMLERSCP